MAYTSWNNVLIKEQYDKVYDLYKSTGEYTYLMEAGLLKKILENNEEIDCFEKNSNTILQLNDNINTYHDYEKYMPYIKQFAKLKLSKKELPDISIYEITPSLLLSFVHDLYNSMPPVIKSKFNKVFKERKDNLKFSEYRSTTIFIPHLNASYINVQVENTIEDFMNIAHEYGHAVADLLSCYYDYFANPPFNELFSLIMELIACDFIDDHYNVPKETILYRAYTWKTVNTFCEDLLMEAKFYRKENIYHYLTNPDVGLARTNMISLEKARNILNMTTIERFAYALPFITAIEFYYLYKKDPELFFRYLLEFMALPIDSNYIAELDKRNLYLNEHGKEYVRKINTDIKKVI